MNNNQLIHKKFLCIGHPRCGTGSMSYYLSQMGYDVGHEQMKKDGTSSWLLAVNDVEYPWGDVNELNKYHFENIIHIVRNPFNAIPSIILENNLVHKISPNNASYMFRRKHIKLIFGIDLPKEINKMNLMDQLEIAIITFLLWNKICEMKNPNIICKIENIKPIQIFNKNGVKIDTCAQNRNEDRSVYVKKPTITKKMWENVHPELLKILEIFCHKYNYVSQIKKNV